MTKLEIEADRLWRQIICLKAKHTCEICGVKDGGFPPHSSHHMIKRRFIFTRWDVDCGIYLCPICHNMAESSRSNWEKLLSAKHPDKMKWLENEREQLPSARFTEDEMKFIVSELEGIKEELDV